MFKLISFLLIGFFSLLVANDYVKIKATPNPDKDFVIVESKIYQQQNKSFQTIYYVEEKLEKYHLVFSSKIDQDEINYYSLKDDKVIIEGYVGNRSFEKYIYVTKVKYPK